MQISDDAIRNTSQRQLELSGSRKSLLFGNPKFAACPFQILVYDVVPFRNVRVLVQNAIDKINSNVQLSINRTNLACPVIIYLYLVQ